MKQVIGDDVALTELELSVRTYNALRVNGFSTVGHVRCHTQHDLIKMPLIGIMTLQEIELAIGLSDGALPGPVPNWRRLTRIHSDLLIDELMTRGYCVTPPQRTAA